jgi:hypothetical protein
MVFVKGMLRIQDNSKSRIKTINYNKSALQKINQLKYTTNID